jgi:hypothetical protein
MCMYLNEYIQNHTNNTCMESSIGIESRNREMVLEAEDAGASWCRL